MSRTVRSVGAGVVVLGLVAAACGTSTTTTTSTTAPTTSTTAAKSVGLAIESTSLGSILETAAGQTLYGHTNDTPSKSNCTGACTSIWVPFTVSAVPSFGAGVNQSLVNRVGSTAQLSYGGHPLYTFAGAAAHATKGQGIHAFGGTWEVVLSTGKLYSGSAKATSTGAGGYGG